MKKKYKIIIGVCIVVILGNIYGKFAVLDEQTYNIALFEKVMSAARSQNRVNMDQKLNPAEKMESDMGKIVQQIPQALSLTESAAKLRFLIDRNKLAVKDSLVFRHEKSKMPVLVKYYTQFSVNGSYKKIKGFISDLQNVPGLLYLDSVKIVRLEENEAGLKLSLGVSILFKKGNP
jgi:Tfp pilus assembly protein PilO